MTEAWVQLYCSSCEKRWKRTAREIPAPDTMFACPDCSAERPVTEFLLTQQDLQTIKNLHTGEDVA